MSHTNTTTNFGLPQFITTDKPAWLTDVNVAYTAIDTAMKNNQTAAASAQGDATQALTDAGNAQTTANAASTKASGAVASISEDFLDSATYAVGDLVMYNNLLYVCHTAVVTPGAWTGATNWTRTDIDTLINNIPTELNDLKDVNIVSSSAGQTIVRNDLNNGWKIGPNLDVLDVSSVVSMGSGFTADEVKCFTTGNTASFVIRGALTATSGSVIGTINNANYRPACSRAIALYRDTDNPAADPLGTVWFYENGNMTYFGNSVTSKNIIISVTYVTKAL